MHLCANKQVTIIAITYMCMEALMVNHDRFGLFRPTTDEQGKVIHPEWKTMHNVHLDVSLFTGLSVSWEHMYTLLV